MPIPGFQPYQYKATDDPLKLAQQNGITTQTLLNANLGGTPFSTGQTINLPYASPANLGMPYQNTAYGPQANVPPFREPVLSQLPAFTPTPLRTLSQQEFLATQYSPNAPVYSQSQGHPDPGLVLRLAQNPEEFNNLTPAQQDAVSRLLEQEEAGDPGFNGGGTLGKGDFYGYERDPETGESVRVVKNAATSSFRNELRWDPRRKKYISVGKFMDEQKKKNTKKSRRPAQRLQQAQQAGHLPTWQTVEKEDRVFTGFGLVSFNSSSG